MRDEDKNPDRSHSEVISGKVGIRAGACGFIEMLRHDNSLILDATSKPDFVGIRLQELIPVDPSERFPVTGRMLSASVDKVSSSVENNRLNIVIYVSTEHLEATYNTRFTPDGSDRLCVDLSVKISGTGWMASTGMVLPLVLHDDPLKRRTTVGGETREETWRLDQNDEDTSEEWQRKVSDKKARWPHWRIGGLLVDAPHHYLIWKSSDYTTPFLPMDQGKNCAGWIMYSDHIRCIRVRWEDVHQQSPAGMTVDGTQGELGIWLHPSAVRPVRINGTVERTIRLNIDFHKP